MSPPLAFEPFESNGRSEWMMRVGPVDAPPILFVPPLFEEMNRLRALIVGVMRGLADTGHGCWLPDLGGTGESPAALPDLTWDDWRHDVKAASDHVAARNGSRPLVASLRGGALLDDAAPGIGHWRLTPVPGASLARDMTRAGLTGVEWAGYAPSPGLRASLEEAVPAETGALRTVRLASEAAAADHKVPGPALWRRSEPGFAPALAEAISEDLVQWRQTCASS